MTRATRRIAAQDIHSMMSAPLLGPDRLIGTITVQSTATNAFNAGDAELLKLLADQAAIALTNAACMPRSRSPNAGTAISSTTRPTSCGASTSDGNFTFFSDSLESRTGWKPEELLGRPFAAIAAEGELGAGDCGI